MTEIWEYVLIATDRQVIEMPKGAEVLSVQVQRDQLCLWVRVVPEAPLIEKEIAIVGTGHPCGFEVDRFIGTVQMTSESLVFHVFEVKDGITSES